MELSELFRYFRRRESPQQLQPSTEELRRQQEHQQEELARQTLIRIYTAEESTIREMAASARIKYGQDVDSRRLAHDKNSKLSREIDEITEAYEMLVLSTIGNPQTRLGLHESALKSAQTYWEDVLAKPDNPTDVTMMGRRRLTRISGKLEKLSMGSKPTE